LSPTGRTPLIVNADDFGASRAVNRGIVHAHREGILTSTSLMVNEPAAEDAVQLARQYPRLAVGLHLVVLMGRSALDHSRIPSLVNEKGFFRTDAFRAGVHYYFSAAARTELRKEMRAQFERFAATGLSCSHVDGHAHMHMHPTVFGMLIELCEEFEVRRVRVVREDIALTLRLEPGRQWSKRLTGATFTLLARSCDRRLRGRGFTTPQRVFGLLQTGDMNENFLCRLVQAMDTVSTEIYAHPLATDAPADEQRDNPGGIGELKAFLSPHLRQLLEERGFALGTYADLEHGR